MINGEFFFICLHFSDPYNKFLQIKRDQISLSKFLKIKGTNIFLKPYN